MPDDFAERGDRGGAPAAGSAVPRNERSARNSYERLSAEWASHRAHCRRSASLPQRRHLRASLGRSNARTLGGFRHRALDNQLLCRLRRMSLVSDVCCFSLTTILSVADERAQGLFPNTRRALDPVWRK